MFDNLKAQPADKILALMKAFREDPRDQKIDLGVGVYKDAEGRTPVMRAIKAAEERVWQKQDSKSYVGLAGDPDFANAMIRLVLNGAVPRDQIAAVATPGGTGACRQAFELVRFANPDARIFVSDPTWPNHVSMLNYLGMERVPYRYFDDETRGVDVDAMLEDIGKAGPNDVVLLHGCCHNPTGANLNPVEWDAVIASLQKTGATAMIDIAYQGFGDGLDEDAAATRKIAAALPQVLIAASCSKNFGVYRERTGLLMMITDSASKTALHQATLEFLNRQNYSFPPDHGARIVTEVLTDDALRADWEVELEAIRTSMLGLREQLASELRQRSGSDRFAFLAQHRGMFSRLGCDADLVERLKTEHGIYMVGDSRMNIAGLNATTVPILAQAIVDVGV